MEDKLSTIQLMTKDKRLKAELTIIALIKNDVLTSILRLEHQKVKSDLDEQLFNFNLNQIVLELMGFTQERIEIEISLVYYFRVSKILKEMETEKLTNAYISQFALKLYYELKKMIE